MPRSALQKLVHLTKAGCLGPCELANLASVIFDGRSVWFHSVNAPDVVTLIFDYSSDDCRGSFLRPACGWRRRCSISTTGSGARAKLRRQCQRRLPRESIWVGCPFHSRLSAYSAVLRRQFRLGVPEDFDDSLAIGPGQRAVARLRASPDSTCHIRP